MKYIVSGPALDKVLRENRIRIARGEIHFTPFADAVPAPVKDIPEDTKDVPSVDQKKPVNGKAKK